MATPPLAWYEAADGDLATDLSGNGYDLAGVAPTYVAAAPSGATVARFNGSTQYLRDTFTLAQPYYLVVVGVVSRAEAGGTVMAGGASGSPNDGVIGYIVTGASSPDPTVYFSAGTSLYPNNAGLDLSEWRRLEAYFNGASSEALMTGPNGGSSTGNAGTNAAGGVTLGADGRAPVQFGDSDIGAALIFATKPSADDLAALRAYLDAKYGT